uniref:Uncharacterized protein n=1 Tax=Fagus sylvatica TaxID=28930 RepID=A0A2N9I6B5_FAGSY
MARISAQRLGGLDFGLETSISAWLGGSWLDGSDHGSQTAGQRITWRLLIGDTFQEQQGGACRHERTPSDGRYFDKRVAACAYSDFAFFAVVSRSAADLPICGFLFVDRCLNAVDLKLGSSGGAVNVSEDSCRVWGRVSAWICLIFPRLDGCRVVFGKVLYGMDVVYKIEVEGKRVVYPKERLSFQMVNLVCELPVYLLLPLTANC